MAVHDGMFHADDVFCVALMRKLAKVCDFELKVYRTRNPQLLQAVNLRADVGGRYDEMSLDFDHHQKDERMEQPEGIRHAAIGLMCHWCMDDAFYRVFKDKYILGLEHQDNTGKPHPKYSSIGFAIQPFLPAYGEEADLNEAFEKAVAVAEIIFERCLVTVEGIIKAEEELPEAIVESLCDGQILVLNKRLTLWPPFHKNLAFAIIPVGKRGYSFLSFNNHLLKPNLRGLKGEKIQEVTGYSGTFTHPDGFTGTMDTLEGVKEICLRSL